MSPPPPLPFSSTLANALQSRRVRVCNLALQTVELAANVFHYADMEAVLAHMARAGEWFACL